MTILFLVLLGLGLLLSVARAPAAVSALLGNAGWVMLNGYQREEQSPLAEQPDPVLAFSRALDLRAGNSSARFGEGMTYALQGRVDEAIASWSLSETESETFIDYGIMARDAGKLDMALTHLRAADALDREGGPEAGHLAGTICQRAYAEPQTMSLPNSRYCSDYWNSAGGNLIINGDLEPPVLSGWFGEHYFAGRSAKQPEVLPDPDTGDFAVRLEGVEDRNHFGLYQRLTLSPGETVRFSGRFKLSGEEGLTARLLYVGWQDSEGVAQGNHGHVGKERMEWTAFERTFTVPAESQVVIDFYPVLFRGVGAVWFDDVRLERIGP